MNIDKVNVFVVEKHPIMAVAIERTIQELGQAAVRVAQSGEEAIFAAASCRPDLVVTDVELGDAFDGIDAARIMLSRFGVRTVFFTGKADDLTRRRAERVSPLAFMDKTAPQEEFKTAIDIVLGQLEDQRGSARVARSRAVSPATNE
jgi:DNA-binding NarL/FixJ family response regulator